MNPFRAAIGARDFEGAAALLADDVGALALAEAMKTQLEAMAV